MVEDGRVILDIRYWMLDNVLSVNSFTILLGASSIQHPVSRFRRLSLCQTMTMPSNDPLHGKTLEMILTELVHHFGWEDLGTIININCFNSNPSIQSSLKFLRKTPWARKKVEELYTRSIT